MKTRLAISILVLLAGCGPHYTIPDSETDDIGKVISSGRSPQGCIDNLHEDAQNLKVKVKLVDVKHEPAHGPIAWIYSNSYTCTGKVVKTHAQK
jgi:hypothetical protein